MKLSEDKISHLSHLLKETVVSQNLGSIGDVNRFLGLTKTVLTDYCRLEEEVDDLVRKKLSSYSRGVMEGSREWDVLYQKHFDDEMKKRW